MAYIGLYMNNPTAGGTDGTAVSLSAAQTAPVTVALDASESEEETVTLALRCDSGYETYGDTEISFTGTNADKWTACLTADGTFASTLTISTTIDDTNTLFYVKAASASTEAPQNDISVFIHVEGVTVAQEA